MLLNVRQTATALLIASSICLTHAAPFACTSESQPDPIAKQYPNDVTGTINGTTAIIPIPYSVARSLIPAQYGILTRAYQSLIPNFPAGMYPAVLEEVVDHDVQMLGFSIGDFQRASIKMPFVDRLNDGYSSFKYSLPILISQNLVALAGSAVYGTTYAGTFNPSCNPYSGNRLGTTYSTAYSTTNPSKPAFNSTFAATSSIPYSIDVFKNVTNQPIFGNGLAVCDNYIVLYNTSVSTGTYAPTPVKGTVSIAAPFYAADATFSDVYGYRMDNAFVERNSKPCASLKGYSGTGSGD